MSRTQVRVACVVVVALVALIGGCIFPRRPPKPDGVVASLRLPDGSEYMVTQERNHDQNPFALDSIRYARSLIWGRRWTSNPYRLSFFMRSPGGPWGWCYIDHLTPYWSDVSMTYDSSADVITITESGRWRAALDRKRSAFSIGDGKPKRELAAPQSLFWQPAYPFP